MLLACQTIPKQPPRPYRLDARALENSCSSAMMPRTIARGIAGTPTVSQAKIRHLHIHTEVYCYAMARYCPGQYTLYGVAL